MKYKRANLEICKAMMAGEDIRAQELEDNRIIVIRMPAYYGYIFNRREIAFNMENVRMIGSELKKIIDLSVVKPENKLTVTDTIKILGYKGDTARVMMSGDKEVWLNTKFLENIDTDFCTFFQDKSDPLGQVIVVEVATPVMCVLPIRHV